MKIDRTKLKKSTTEVPVDCRTLIDKLKNASEEDLHQALKDVKVWTHGKCELYHWADVLDIFDGVLEKACKKETDRKWTLSCDLEGNKQLKDLLLNVLRFTSLLIEHSFSRHLYNSMEYLTMLLSSCDMHIVLEVLNLLYVFSKRSNFITRLGADKKQGLVIRLTHLAESWGGKDNGFGLAECCTNMPMTNFPTSATTLHFEFYMESEDKTTKKGVANCITSIHMDSLDKATKLPSEIMEELMTNFRIPDQKQMLLYTHIRLAHLFSNYEARVQCVQARLQALAILVYSNAIQDNMNALLYPGLIEELVDIVELKDASLVDIKAAALRTLTSIIHLERNPKLNNIIECTGAGSYHGFLPVLVRNCIQHMTDRELAPYSQPYATALFSFLYHLASYENGVEALVSCGMMESLLKVINWYGDGQEHITFATRAVRVVDLITNLDMAAFQTHGGLNAFINRLEHEVDICRIEQPYEIRPPNRQDSVSDVQPESPPTAMEMDTDSSPPDTAPEPSSSEVSQPSDDPATSVQELVDNAEAGPSSESQNDSITENEPRTGVQCFPQRAALLKSMLNFLKKAIPDPAFAESIRHLMDGSLPKTLKHIISNAEYYGPSLFLLATDVVTVYVFQEPSLLSSLQDNGLTDVVLNALLIKDVPATREVLASLPNVFSALCLNARGLEAFVLCRPFDRLFKVLLSPDYLPAMRRRRNSDPFGDTASNLGNAMDELMRHQPSLRTDATTAIIKLLEEVCAMGRDPKFVCQKPQPKTEQNIVMSLRSPHPADTGSSDEEEDEEELTSQPTLAKQSSSQESLQISNSQNSQDRQAIPLMDYVLNVMKFVDAILSNNSTDDHCREFVTQKGLLPLMGILGLPNLPIDFPASPACQAVASVCKAILTLSREPQVLKQGLLHLNEVLQTLEPLHKPLDHPGGSVLLRELASVATHPDATLSPQATPLLHALSAAHAYITMFVHVCRMGQTDIRTISVSHWGSELGLQVLNGLSKLYTSLVWESTILLALCSEDILPADCDFGKSDMEKLLPKDFKPEKDGKEDESALTRSTGDMGSNGVSAAMESLTTSEHQEAPMEVTENANLTDKDKKSKLSPTLQAQVKQLKPLLSVSSRLGRALAELFGLLVKLCVGTPVRQRRSQQLAPTPTTPTPAAQAVAKALTKLLANGLMWTPPAYSPVPKLRLTFLVCSVGFTSPMLFDEKKQPYHLMLQKFVASAGQDALFQAFSWALSMDGKSPLTEGLENADLPDGTGEFLDAWLMLIEKMVNPKTILESPHTLPSKSSQPGFVPFSPVQYLISTQKAAFNAVMNLWNKKPLKTYGSRMSESILAILCHIIKGEKIITEHLAKENGEETADSSAASVSGTVTAAAAAVAAARREEPEINPVHLQTLMDMGFTREHCTEALLHTASLEQATDYILTHPPSALQVTGLQTLGLDMDMSEEDQMMRAIAMSLGDNAVVSTDPQAQQPKQEENKEEEAEPEKQETEEPLDKAVLDHFTSQVFAGCMSLLDTLPETVYRMCELLIVVTHRNGKDWQNQTLVGLVQEIQTLGHSLLSASNIVEASGESSSQTPAEKLVSLPEASKFAARIHLFSLLFEEMMMACAETLECSNLIELLVQVLSTGQECLAAVKEATSPNWLAPLLLLLDSYEKVSVISKRKAEAEKLLAHSHTWKWFDDGSGRWCKYSLSNNKTIDDAYQNGEISVRFQAGRRRYNVHFSTMVQVNEETGNRRPIMLTLPTVEEKQQAKEESKEENIAVVGSNTEQESTTANSEKAETKMETEVSESKKSKMETEPQVIEKKRPETKILCGLNSDQVTNIIRSIVSLLNIPVEPDALHAALRLILRLTRMHEFAVLFAELGGPKLLLNLTQASAFQGFVSLATLILRHILEDPNSLRYCMEKVVKSATSGSGSSMSGVAQGSLGSKELHYVLRVLGPAACRNPAIFTDVAKETLRIALPQPSKRAEDETRYIGNNPQILKCLPTKQQIITTVESPIKEVVCELLNTLIVKYAWNQDEVATNSSEVRPVQTLAEAISDVVNEYCDRHPEMVGQQNNASELPPGEDDTTTPTDASEQGSSKDVNKDSKTAEENRKQKPLLPKSAVLRLISEVIKSYSNCTQFITQYIFHAGQSDLVIEDCTVLGFVLDNLLPQCQKAGDRDCPALSRVLVAGIASCNHSPDAQMTLVSEVKAALQRALALPESSEKHSKLQALTNIISTMIESCPTPGQIPNQVFKGQQTLINNIVKCLLKKGLVTDLARIPHSLDLSSPYMASTINSALKPLETLSRSVNQPLQSVVAKTVKSKTDVTNAIDTGGTTRNESAANNPHETVSGTTEGEGNMEGDVTIEDVTDQTDQHADLEESEPLATVEPGDVPSDIIPSNNESELENVLQQLLQGNGNANPESQVLGEIIMDTDEQNPNDDESQDVIIDVEVEGEDMDHHDSAMITQEISEGEDEDADDPSRQDDVHNDDDSASGSDADEDDDDEDNDDNDNDDDDQDDDDEEDEEDDEGSDMEADDEDYADMDISNRREIDENFVFHIEDMFPPGHQNAVLNAYDNQLVPSVPPAPSSVAAAHPLLVRQTDAHGIIGIARVHRGGRQRGTCRYNPNTQTLHVNFPRQPNPPVILQRLLGPTTAADVLQLTNTLTTQAGPAHTRVVLANDDLRIISRPEEDLFEELFQDSYSENSPAGSGVLSCIPSTLTRWTEEAKVLDGDSVHDCVTVLKPEVVELLEKHRDEEWDERREKRKKATEEEAAKKEKGKDSKDPNQTLEWVTPPTSREMEVSESSGQANNTTVSSNSNTETSVGSSVSTPLSTAIPPTPVTASESSSGRQISVSEAVAAAETIASAMVEEVLSSPVVTAVSSSTSSLPPAVTSVLTTAGQRTEALTLTTPAQTIPVIAPMAPSRMGPAYANSTFFPQPYPAGCNLASLLLSEDDGPLIFQQLAGSTNSSDAQNDPSQGRQPTPGAQPSNEASITPEEPSVSPEELFAGLLTPREDQPALSTGLPQSENSNQESEQGSSSGRPEGANTEFVRSLHRSLLFNYFESITSDSETPVSSSSATEQAVDTVTTSTPVTTTAPSTASTDTPSEAAPMFGEGVDPSFLAALPDNIRQEVIAEQLRLQRIQQRAHQQAQAAESSGCMEVNPDFLAALPLSIQEEVLAQQRTEQARLSAQVQSTSNPETPVDPASFLSSLPSSLRQQVLSELDDNTVAVLPPDLASEAQSLRRDLEERHRRMMQERLFAQAGAGSLSAILRHTGLAGARLGRYIRAPRCGTRFAWSQGRPDGGQMSSSNTNSVKVRGRHLLDHDALTCLLVLLFVDEPKLNTGRLHRVLRNLCYHGPTRAWVVRALLSILHKTGDCKQEGDDKTSKTPEKVKKKSSHMHSDSSMSMKTENKTQGSWLSISLEAALGCRANVFQIQKSGKKHTSGTGNHSNTTVTIHPQASPVVCTHVLDTLISLAKIFPSQFLPTVKAKEVQKCDTEKDGKEKEAEKLKQGSGGLASPRAGKSGIEKAEGKQDTDSKLGTERRESKQETDFWDLLIKLDSLSSSRKGKGVQRTHSVSAVDSEMLCSNFDSSPLGQLMGMMSHPVIRRSQLLTDRLLRLLGLMSVGLSEFTQRARAHTVTQTSTSGALSVNTSTMNVITGLTSRGTSTAPISMVTAAAPSIVMPQVNPAPVASQSAEKSEEKAKEEVDQKPENDAPILESQLKLAVQVLTSKSCSEEGLEDATNLLLQLSWANNATRTMVLQLLLDGARELGMTVCQHIQGLLVDLKDLHNKIKPELDGDEPKEVDQPHAFPGKGMLQDRFSPGVNVVVSAPKKIKSGRELQLPSMSLLTSKSSSQQFLLRILKVIIQLRDAARNAAKKLPPPRPESRDLGNIAEAMAALEAETDAIMDIMNQRVQQRQQAPPQSASSSIPDREEASEPNTNNSETEPATDQPASSDQPATAGGAEPEGSTAPQNEAPETPMEVDQPGVSSDKKTEEQVPQLPRLSEQLMLEDLWMILGDCLSELAQTPDHHAVLILQPAVEAFFIVHAGEKENKPREQQQQKREDQLAHLNIDFAPASPAAGGSSMDNSLLISRENSVASIVGLPTDTQKFLKFAETHRTVLNQILRQSTTPLVDGPFSVLVDHTRILDFDVKRRYFRQELERLDEGMRREDLAVHVRRENVFEDSFRELFRRSAEEWKHRFYIVFEGEEGQDAGGLLREWYVIISREIFNPMYALFATSSGDRVTYTVNPLSHCNSNHLSYYKFVGRIIAKAIYDNKLLECYFTRSFYKHIIGQAVKYTDMESEDYSFYQGLVFLMENDVGDLGYELTFSTEIQEFGVEEVRDLKPNGRNIPVSEDNKKEYVKLVCQMKMTGAIRKQLNSFMEGFYDIIPKRLISIFNEQELELLISGLPIIDIDDLKANSEYHKYQPNSLQIQWFWRALRSFDQADRARFLQFVTGTSKVPLQGFAFLEGMNGTQKFQIHRDDRSTDRLPTAHTCFNQLDLPAYETYDKLRHQLLLAVNECSEGFGLA